MMSKLNRDVLYLILKELHNDKKLHYCFLANKIWCEIIIPFLWRNPWNYLYFRERTYVCSSLNLSIKYLVLNTNI
jgi:hypothetical protein